MSELSDYLPTPDAAALLGMAPTTLTRAIHAGKVPGAQKIGHLFMIPRAWIEEKRAEKNGTISQAEAGRMMGISRQRVAQLIKAGRIKTIGGRVVKTDAELHRNE